MNTIVDFNPVAYSLESHFDLVGVDELGRGVHDAAKEAAALLATHAAHHLRGSAHHEDEEADDEEGGQETRQTRRLDLGFVDDRYMVDRFDALLFLGMLQVALKRVHAADVEP